MIEQAIRDQIAAVEETLANLRALLDSMPEAEAIVPVTVLVHWSESNHFSVRGKVYPFSVFEAKARLAARDYGSNSGYAKTKVTVTLSNGEQVQFRCDLAEDDDHGAASVISNYQRAFEEDPDMLDCKICGDFYRAINSITLPD